MVFVVNQEQNESNTFKDMLLQPDKSDLIPSIIKCFEAHEAIINWTLIKNIEVKNRHKNIDENLKTILSIWSFKCKRFLYGILMKHKDRICTHGAMQQWVFNYWETYAPVKNWISLMSLLYIASIYEFSRISIDCLRVTPQDDLDVHVFMDLPLGMAVNVNGGE